VHIDQMTSEVTAGITNDKPKATVTKVRVTGATVAGMVVGITEKGIVGLGSETALAPVIDALLKPLADQGLKIRTTPSSAVSGARTAVATGGGLEIEAPISVQGYPGVLTVTVGRALAELEVGALSDDTGASFDDDTGSLPDDSGSFPLPGLGDSATDLPGLPSSPAVTPGGASGTELVSVPVRRVVEDWDVTTLYRVLLLGGIALFAAGQVIVRSTTRPSRRSNDLRQLWRW
jgi:hypothetical protein